MKHWLTLLALVALATAACGGGGSESARTGDVAEEAAAQSPIDAAASPSAWVSDPCSLIGDDEMSAMLPNPVAGSVTGTGLCEYGPVDLSLGRVDVEVFVQDVAATGCDLFFSVGGFNSAEPIEGIGTSARWKGGSGIKQLGVCVGDQQAFTVNVYDPDQRTDPLATARAVGELVIARF